GLTHPRFARDEDDARATGAHVGERIVERAHCSLPSDEVAARRSTRRVDERGPRLFSSEPTQHFGGAWPILGNASQQLDAERVEILGQRRNDLARSRRLEALLVDQDLRRQTEERKPPGERLVEADADGVPIGGGG